MQPVAPVRGMCPYNGNLSSGRCPLSRRASEPPPSQLTAPAFCRHVDFFFRRTTSRRLFVPSSLLRPRSAPLKNPFSPLTADTVSSRRPSSWIVCYSRAKSCVGLWPEHALSTWPRPPVTGPFLWWSRSRLLRQQSSGRHRRPTLVDRSRPNLVCSS